jgi:hypothetical protein
LHKQLSATEEAFCNAYIACGNGAEAYLVAFPDRPKPAHRRSEAARRIKRRFRVASRLAELRRDLPPSAVVPTVDEEARPRRRKQWSEHARLTARHEAFAKAYARLGSLSKAYLSAYPDSEEWPSSKRNSYGRDLSTRPHIANRITQLQEVLATGGLAALLAAPDRQITPRPAIVSGPGTVADLEAVAAVAFSESAAPEIRLIALRTLTAQLAAHHVASGQVSAVQITLHFGGSG